MVITTYHEIANLFLRTMRFEFAGDAEEDQGHVHTYDHAHFLSNGSMEIEVAGEKTVFVAPAVIYIKAGLVHRLVALEPGTIGHCIHALRSQDLSGEPIDPACIPKGVSAFVLADPIHRAA